MRSQPLSGKSQLQPGASGTRRWIYVRRAGFILIIIGLTGLAAFKALRHGSQSGLDDRLVGRWKCDIPAYADRFFELRGDTIVLGLGNDQVSIQTISSVERQEHEHCTDYIISTLAYNDEQYRPEDQHETRWNFAYMAEEDGAIQFNHQPGKWRKISRDTPLLDQAVSGK